MPQLFQNNKQQQTSQKLNAATPRECQICEISDPKCQVCDPVVVSFRSVVIIQEAIYVNHRVETQMRKFKSKVACKRAGRKAPNSNCKRRDT